MKNNYKFLHKHGNEFIETFFEPVVNQVSVTELLDGPIPPPVMVQSVPDVPGKVQV